MPSQFKSWARSGRAKPYNVREQADIVNME